VSKKLTLRRLLPIVVSAVLVVLAYRFVSGPGHRLNPAEVLDALRNLPLSGAIIGGLLVVVLYGALALCEMVIAGYVAGPVSGRRAALGALLAAPIGHALGFGAVSGGAIRYRLYSAVGMRPLDIGKMILLAAIPYPAGLGLLLAGSLLLQTEAAAPLLHTSPALARGIAIALVALHLGYLTLVTQRLGPMAFGRFVVTLPTPRLTAVQYVVGLIEVCCGASVLYVLLPSGIDLPFTVYMGVYVVSILAGLASGLPAGVGVFDVAILALLPRVPQAQLLASMIAYRSLLELVPFLLALVTFAAYEVWWRLPAQRARAARIAAADAEDD
jgi:uncharacterized membrane protein YbhN (UPF0104 family)